MAEFGIGSDYKTKITFMDGAIAIPDPQINAKVPQIFFLEFYTSSPNGSCVAKRENGQLVNCVFSEGKLIVSLDKPNFNEGIVKCKATYVLPDETMTDNFRTIVLNIETQDKYVAR